MSRIDELMALIRAEIICHIASHGQHDWAPKIERALRDALEPQGWQLVPQRLLMRVHACLAADWRDQPHNKDLRALCDEVWQAAAPKEPTRDR